VSYGFYRPESNNRWNPRFISHASAKGTNHVWVTLDHKEDYEMIRQIHEDLSKSKPHYTVVDVVQWIKAHPALQEACLNIRKEKKASV
jgi:spore coat polysaccharide biosynthesis protein SpsF (cytidylyltransferase family)